MASNHRDKDNIDLHLRLYKIAKRRDEILFSSILFGLALAGIFLIAIYIYLAGHDTRIIAAVHTQSLGLTRTF